jgi:hypothetical protein
MLRAKSSTTSEGRSATCDYQHIATLWQWSQFASVTTRSDQQEFRAQADFASRRAPFLSLQCVVGGHLDIGT